MNLAGEHQVELNRYLTYFRSKKDGVLKEVDQALNEFREDNVTDSIFNREDVTTPKIPLIWSHTWHT